MALSAYNIFLLPLDIANQAGEFQTTNSLDTYTLEIAFFVLTSCVVIVIIPFSMFYYEGVDDTDEADDKTWVSYPSFLLFFSNFHP